MQHLLALATEQIEVAKTTQSKLEEELRLSNFMIATVPDRGPDVMALLEGMKSVLLLRIECNRQSIQLLEEAREKYKASLG